MPSTLLKRCPILDLLFLAAGAATEDALAADFDASAALAVVTRLGAPLVPELTATVAAAVEEEADLSSVEEDFG